MPVTVASLQAILDLDKRGFDKGMKSADSMLTGLATGVANKGIELLSSGISALGNTMVDSISKAADLESQLDAIGAISGATEEEIAGLGEVVSNLGLDPNLKVTAFEAAQAVEELAAGGVALEDIMNGAAKGTVALANATGADFAQSATIAADSMAIFGIEAKNLEQVIDGVAAVIVSSKFDANDYALALAQAGGVAKTSGVEFDDFNTAIAGIASLFASGSDAGTSFKTFLQRLTPSTDPAIEAMTELGIITEESGNRFYDAQGNLKSMAEIAGVLDTAMSGLSEAQRNEALSTIFGTDAMRAAVGLMDLGGKGFTDLQVQMSNTSGFDAAAMRMDNTKGVMERLLGVTDGLQLMYGTKLLPKMSELGEKAISFASNQGPALVDSLADISLSIIEFGQMEAPFIFKELSDVFGGMGANLEKLNTAAQKTAELLGVSSEKAGEFSLTGKALETVLGALTQPLDLVNATLGFMLDNVISALEETTALKDAIVGLADGTRDLSDRLYDLGAALADMAIPDWVIGNSPSPLENSLRGIADAVSTIKPLEFGGGGMGGMIPIAAGGGNTTHETHIHMGGQSFGPFTGAGGNDQALLAMVQFLRAQLDR